MEKLLNKKCIFRGDRSGVFFGTLVSQNGQTVEIKDCRRIWYWNGAYETLDMAQNGISSDSKVTCVVETIVLTDCIQITPCTEKAISNIEGQKVWTRA